MFYFRLIYYTPSPYGKKPHEKCSAKIVLFSKFTKYFFYPYPRPSHMRPLFAFPSPSYPPRIPFVFPSCFVRVSTELIRSRHGADTEGIRSRCTLQVGIIHLCGIAVRFFIHGHCSSPTHTLSTRRHPTPHISSKIAPNYFHSCIRNTEFFV